MRKSARLALASVVGLALGAGPSCPARPRADESAAPARGRLLARAASHDFGAVPSGPVVQHAFTVENAGGGPVAIARIDRSPACHATKVPGETIAPGAAVSVLIECATEGRPGNLSDLVSIVPNDHGPPAVLRLSASVTPVLAFATTLVTLETLPGRSETTVVRLIGAQVASARLTVIDTGRAPRLNARPLPPGDARGPGLELTLGGDTVGEWSDRVLVSTGVAALPRLVLPYAARVKSALTIDPDRPFFNLHDPGGGSLLVSVRSNDPGFRVRAVKILDGAFTAALANGGVRVTADPTRAPPGQTGFTGTLLIVTNDRAEPRREVRLFALGAPPHRP